MPDKSERIIGRVQKTLLESSEEARHIQCPKLNRYTGYLENKSDYEGDRENLRS
jgi:hypothetical protein